MIISVDPRFSILPVITRCWAEVEKAQKNKHNIQQPDLNMRSKIGAIPPPSKNSGGPELPFTIFLTYFRTAVTHRKCRGVKNYAGYYYPGWTRRFFLRRRAFGCSCLMAAGCAYPITVRWTSIAQSDCRPRPTVSISPAISRDPARYHRHHIPENPAVPSRSAAPIPGRPLPAGHG